MAGEFRSTSKSHRISNQRAPHMLCQRGYRHITRLFAVDTRTRKQTVDDSIPHVFSGCGHVLDNNMDHAIKGE